MISSSLDQLVLLQIVVQLCVTAPDRALGTLVRDRCGRGLGQATDLVDLLLASGLV